MARSASLPVIRRSKSAQPPRTTLLTVDYSVPGAIETFDRAGRLLWRYSPTGPDSLRTPSLALPLPTGDIICNDDANNRGHCPKKPVNQVQGAFSAEHGDPTEAPTYTPDERTIGLTLAKPHDVKVTLWWTTSTVPPDPKSDSLVLLDDVSPPAIARSRSPTTFRLSARSPACRSTQPSTFFSIATEQ